MTATGLPAICTALTSKFTTALAATSVEVHFGIQPAGIYGSGDVLIVGFGDESNPYARVERQPFDGPAKAMTVTAYINCGLFLAAGDGTASERLSVADARMSLIDTAVRADRSLGIGVSDAYVGPSVEFFTADGPSGNVADVQFAVVVESYL